MARTTTRTANRFALGSGVFTCRSCDRKTRDTGGDNTDIRLCDECYELSSQENSLSDSRKLYGNPQGVKATMDDLDAKIGAGRARQLFPEVAEAVDAALAPAKTAEAPAQVVPAQVVPAAQAAPSEIRIALHTPAGDVVTSYPASMEAQAQVMVVAYLSAGKHFSVSRA
ncbi:hypothetical protein ACT80S_18630 [Ramlibacter sp. MAHUQ-53]|uniref:hypothetical protein n=1 Tax=unclassified Ramlibacter TaxID=2617605 RepID=UPI00362C2F49